MLISGSLLGGLVLGGTARELGPKDSTLLRGRTAEEKWGFPKIRGTFFGGLHDGQ